MKADDWITVERFTATNTLWRKQSSDIKMQISAYSASCNPLKNQSCEMHQCFLNQPQERLCSVHTHPKKCLSKAVGDATSVGCNSSVLGVSDLFFFSQKKSTLLTIQPSQLEERKQILFPGEKNT